MTRGAVILRNVASNWVGFGVNAVVTLLLTPFVLRELGTTRYGIWILTSSIIGYYGFLDLGFRAGVTQYLTRHLAVRDYQKASGCMSSAVAVLGSLGIAMFGLSVIAAYVAPHVFDVPPDLMHEAFWCVLIVGCSSAVQFALSPYGSVFTAMQRFDLANAIGITTRILTAAGIVASLGMGRGLIGVSLATCSVSAVDYIIRWRVARWLVPAIELSVRHASMRQVREIGAFGVWNALISVNFFVYQHVPNILIAAVMPVAAVGHYALATGLTRQINAILGPLPAVLYPAATELHVRGDHKRLEQLYWDGSRMTMLVMIPLVLAAAIWAHDFYRLWIGERYLGGGQFQSVAVLFQILLVSTAAGFAFTIAQQILIGAGKVRVVAITLISGSAINLGVSLVMIHFYGLAGVAIATASAAIVVDLIAIPILLERDVRLSFARFIRNSCGRPIAAGVLQGAAMMLIRLSGPALTWDRLIAHAALAGFSAAVILVTVGVTSDERQQMLFRPVRRWTAMFLRSSAVTAAGNDR